MRKKFSVELALVATGIGVLSLMACSLYYEYKVAFGEIALFFSMGGMF